MGRIDRVGRSGRSLVVFALTLALTAAAAMAGAEPGATGPAPTKQVEKHPRASAVSTDMDALKSYWQGRYRGLRMKEARLIETVKVSTKEYADSNRRNYRRSGVRHFHRTNANEAKAELRDVRRQIEALFGQVVEAGGSVNWFYEVDDDPIDPSRTSALGVYGDEGRFGGKGAYAPTPEDDAPARAQDDDPGVELGTDDGRVDALERGQDEETETETDEGYDDGRNPLYSREQEGEDEEDEATDTGNLGDFDYEKWRTDRGDYEKQRAPERHLDPDDY